MRKGKVLRIVLGVGEETETHFVGIDRIERVKTYEAIGFGPSMAIKMSGGEMILIHKRRDPEAYEHVLWAMGLLNSNFLLK